jgi:mersacidin/lichenicidin family type 2 lantibiotic
MTDLAEAPLRPMKSQSFLSNHFRERGLRWDSRRPLVQGLVRRLQSPRAKSQVRAEKSPHLESRNPMSHRDIIRAWKDAEFRSSLSEAERAMLPSHPAGSIELADPELDRTVGRASGLRVKSTLKAGSQGVKCVSIAPTH